MFFTSRTSNDRCRRSERGATLTGYSLTLAVMVVVALGSMSALESNSEDFLENTGDKIGEPRESAQVAVSIAQQSYGGGNSKGNGASPPATPAPNVSTPSTTPSSTSSTSSTTASTTPSSTSSSSTSSTTAPAVLSAMANITHTGSSDYYNSPGPFLGSIPLTAAGPGTYDLILTGMTTSSSSDNSFWVSINGGTPKQCNFPWNTPTTKCYTDPGGPWDSAHEVDFGITTATDGEPISIEIYARERDAYLGGVELTGP